jgi:excisionase family DNA binding protein
MADRVVLTVPEAADSLQVSRATIYRLLADGVLESIKVRGVTRIRPTAIARYLDTLERCSRQTWAGFDA